MLLRIAHAALNAPTRLRDRVHCARLRALCAADAQATFTPEARIFNSLGREAVTVGKQSLLMGEMLVIGPSGRISVGDWCYIGPNSKIWAMSSIRVGNRVFVSHGVQIFDNNSHSLSAGERHARYRELRELGQHQQAEIVTNRPVHIEDDVWIGFNAAVLKGVTVGQGAVVGACAVVVDDVPPYAVVVGNPARKVGEARP
jgi:acetyltransferase-like isoleucine patch superfamily enzyme